MQFCWHHFNSKITSGQNSNRDQTVSSQTGQPDQNLGLNGTVLQPQHILWEAELPLQTTSVYMLWIIMSNNQNKVLNPFSNFLFFHTDYYV